MVHLFQITYWGFVFLSSFCIYGFLVFLTHNNTSTFSQLLFLLSTIYFSQVLHRLQITYSGLLLLPPLHIFSLSYSTYHHVYLSMAIPSSNQPLWLTIALSIFHFSFFIFLFFPTYHHVYLSMAAPSSNQLF